MILVAFRRASHMTTLRSPGKLVFGRTLKIKIDMKKPREGSDETSGVEENLNKNKLRKFEIGDPEIITRIYND